MKILSRDTISISSNSNVDRYIERERDYYTENQPEKYKKVIYEEELDSEPELEENDCVYEEIEEEPEKTEPKKVKNEKIIFSNI